MAFQPSEQPYHWTFRRVVFATLFLACILFGFWLIYRFYQVVFILFIATVIGTVIRPLVNLLHRRGLPRISGILLVYLLALILIISFMLLLFPLILKQATTIAAEVPAYYHSLRQWMVTYPDQFIVRLGMYLPAAIPDLVPAQPTGSEVLASAGQVLGYAVSAARMIFIAIVLLFLVFYWTLDGPRLIKSLLRLVPLEKRESIADLISAIENKVGLFLAGQALLCLAIAVMALVAYLLIGLPNALSLAFVAGVMEAVPMVGPTLGAIPAALVALSIAPAKLVWVVLAYIVIQESENIFLVPRIMRRAVGVNPFVTLLSLFAFSSFFGIAGALMAIPLAAIIQLILDRFVFHPSTMEPEVASGRDQASRLRYQAQQLVSDLRKQARLGRGTSDPRIKQIDRVMDEIESISTDLDVLLAQDHPAGEP